MILAVITAGIGYAYGGLVARDMEGWVVACWSLVVSLPILSVLMFFVPPLKPTSPHPWKGERPRNMTLELVQTSLKRDLTHLASHFMKVARRVRAVPDPPPAAAGPEGSGTGGAVGAATA